MNWVDGVIVVVVVANGIVGYLSGLVWQVTGLATIILGAGLGWILSPAVGSFFRAWTRDEFGARLIGFFLVFATVSVVLRLGASFVKVYVKKWKIERHDQKLGAVFGVVKALLIIVIVCTGYVMSRPERDQAVRESLLGPSMVRLGRLFVPEGGDEKIRTWLDETQQELEALKREAVAPPSGGASGGAQTPEDP